MEKIIKKRKFLTLSFVFVCGIFLFLIGLGSTGLVDETPPLFASAGRAMSQSGDWLTPRVNGILRFDKPPLFYWLMAFFYALPGNENWDSLGSLSARLPSALSSIILMLMLADTILFIPEKLNNKFNLSLITAFAFALSPLVLIWSRAAVSDSLLCGTLGMSLLLFWRKIIQGNNYTCFAPWLFLGLAVLTKGPVAFVLVFLTLTCFMATQSNWKKSLLGINPVKGIFITTIVSFPWYLLEFVNQGRPFLNSFFGYHNLQRYTSVVNNHSEPWWFFLSIMILGSLPFSIFLLNGIFLTARGLFNNWKKEYKPSESLYIFALCWLVSVFMFFSLSATKLPSYWLPATPAVAILISQSANTFLKNKKNISIVLTLTTLILLGLSIAFFLSENWLALINDPEMPNLASEIRSSGLLIKVRLLSTFLTIISLVFLIGNVKKSILYLQVFFLFGQSYVMVPVRNMTDRLRQLPLRNVAKKIIQVRKTGEPIAMVGIRKPSLHFYSKQIVFYESSSKSGIINLSERFEIDKRVYDLETSNHSSESFLVVIDNYSEEKDHWKNFNHQKLGQYGIYKLIRIKKVDLSKYAVFLKTKGISPNWEQKNFEKF